MKINQFIALLPIFACCSLNAKPLDLEISGNIETFTDSKRAVYTLADSDLKRLPLHRIVTSTAWTPLSTFEGAALSDILALVRSKGHAMTVYALDNYATEIPVSDVPLYEPIVAYRINGKALTVRDFGPLFIVYPRDQFPNQLNSATYDSRFVWQVHKIVLK